MKRILSLALILSMLCILCACDLSGSEDNSNSEIKFPVADNPGKGEVSKFDTENKEDKNSVQITLANGATTVKGAGVTVDGNTVRITAEGTYTLTGTLTEGQIIVAAEKTEKVRLILNGVSVTSKTSAPLCVESADKVVVTLNEGTVNTFSDAYRQQGTSNEESETDINACIYAFDDITFNGDGTLNVEGSNNGIGCKNDIRLCGGTINVTAVKNGIKGKDSVFILAGTVNVTAGKDGIKATNLTESDRGYVMVSGGTVSVTAKDDGIQAVSDITINDGSVTVKASDSKLNCDGTTNVAEGCLN